MSQRTGVRIIKIPQLVACLVKIRLSHNPENNEQNTNVPPFSLVDTERARKLLA